MSAYYGVYAEDWISNLTAVQNFEHDAQKAVSVVMWYQGWGVTNGSQNFEPSWMTLVRNHGSIPMVTWEPYLYNDPNGPVNQPTYSLLNIINGNFDAYITKWAQDSKAWGHPYFLRFAHEMNGNWYSWCEGVNGNTQGQYAQAWQHVHNIFTAQNVTNVTWVWCPNVEYPGSTSLAELYPGDAYVDWLAMDGYNKNNPWKTFTQVFQQTYNDLVALSSKPIYIAEIGAVEGSDPNAKANWITDALGTQMSSPSYSQLYGFTWYNKAPYNIESSPNATAAFANAVASSFYMSNIYGGLNTSPIPLPG